ncbi:MAG: DUF2617 family protein [Patescibacteria group bacterium]
MEPDPHNYRALTLSIETDVHDIPLTVYAQNIVSWISYEISLYVIGESHAITIRENGRPIFRELFACVSPKHIDAAAIVHRLEDLQIGDHRLISLPNQYTILIKVLDQEPEWISRIQYTQNSLVHVFPRYAYEIDPPYTALQWVFTASDARWKSIHAYDDAGSRVYVETSTVLKPSCLK